MTLLKAIAGMISNEISLRRQKYASSPKRYGLTSLSWKS
jgi:hypothetical protein